MYPSGIVIHIIISYNYANFKLVSLLGSLI
jgi:hypothetical protein